MLPEVLAHLICPLCAQGLDVYDAAVGCAAGHRYDVARQGHVNLLPGGSPAGLGDSAAMVRARAEFLDAGHFTPLTTAVREAVTPVDGLVVDVGAGTGHHLRSLVDGSPEAVGLAVDGSKHAARLAARCHPRAAAVVADIWRGLPVATGAAALVLDVFSPRNGAEFHRVLRPDGRLVVAVPRPEHLRELASIVDMVRVDERKGERLSATLSMFDAVAEAPVTWTMRLQPGEAASLVLMGPSARHLDADAVTATLAQAGPLAVTGAADVHVFAPRR